MRDIENKIYMNLDDFEKDVLSKISELDTKITNKFENFKTKIEDINCRKNIVKNEFNQYEKAIRAISKLQNKKIVIEEVDYNKIKKDLISIFDGSNSEAIIELNKMLNEKTDDILSDVNNEIDSCYKDTIQNIYTTHLQMRKTSVALFVSAASVDVLNEIITFTNQLDNQVLTKFIDEIEESVVKRIKFQQDIKDNRVLYYLKATKCELEILIQKNKKRKQSEKESVFDFLVKKMKNIEKMMKKE